MSHHQWKILGLTVAFVYMLSLGFMLPEKVSAKGEERVELCHQKSGTYKLINIAKPDVPSHVAHGDAAPGEPVPVAPDVVFAEDCTHVEAAICPCAFSVESYLAIAEFGDPADGDCVVKSEVTFLRHNPTNSRFEIFELSCFVNFKGVVITGRFCKKSEACNRCVFDIVSTANVLGIPGC